MSDLEAALLFQIKASGLPLPEAEYPCAPPRNWRFDFAWPGAKLAVECEGATFSGGRHTSGAGFRNDCLKYNAAALLGWRVLRFDRALIESGAALTTIAQALTGATLPAWSHAQLTPPRKEVNTP